MTETSPLIYAQLSKVQADIGVIEKREKNDHFKYNFRSIDQVFNALHPALTKNKVVMVPKLLYIAQEPKTRTTFDKYKNVERTTEETYTHVQVEYTFFAEDGSNVVAVFPGEASDQTDKSTNKAMQAALKYMVLQMFVVPTKEDGENDEPEKKEVPPPEKKPSPNKPPAVVKPDESGDPTISENDFNELLKFASECGWSEAQTKNWCMSAFKATKKMKSSEYVKATEYIGLHNPDGSLKE